MHIILSHTSINSKTFAGHRQSLHLLGGYFLFLFRSRYCKNESRANCIYYWKRNQPLWRDLIYAILIKTWDSFTKREAKGWVDAEALYTLYLSLVQRLTVNVLTNLLFNKLIVYLEQNLSIIWEFVKKSWVYFLRNNLIRNIN